MWIKANNLERSVVVEIVGLDTQKRSDHLIPSTWVNINTGARVHMINDGGWNESENSSFRVFLESPEGNRCTEITKFFGDTEYDTITGEDGKTYVDYSKTERRISRAIENLLSVREEGQEKATGSENIARDVMKHITQVKSMRK